MLRLSIAFARRVLRNPTSKPHRHPVGHTATVAAGLGWKLAPLRAVSWLALQVLGPFRVSGARRIPRQGPLIVLANHISDADPVALQAACPRHLVPMADEELWSMSGVRRILELFGAIPVRRGTADRRALRAALELLRSGGALSLYPEGQISESGELLPLQPGVAFLQQASEATLICAGLVHTNRIRPYVPPGSDRPKVTRRSGKWVEVRWGEPIGFPKGTETEEILAWVDAELRRLTKSP